jgi:hypothetical protein
LLPKAPEFHETPKTLFEKQLKQKFPTLSEEEFKKTVSKSWIKSENATLKDELKV